MSATIDNHAGGRPPSAGLPARLRRLVDLLDSVLVTIGSLMMLALMFVVVADVGLRYLFNAPLAWSYEVVSSYLMPGLFFLAVSHTLKEHGHVAVDILHNYVSRRTRYALHALTSSLAAPVFCYCAVVAMGRTIEDFQTGAASTSGLALPTWTISLMLPLGFGLLALRLALDATGYAATLVSGREVIGLPPISGTEE